QGDAAECKQDETSRAGRRETDSDAERFGRPNGKQVLVERDIKVPAIGDVRRLASDPSGVADVVDAVPPAVDDPLRPAHRVGGSQPEPVHSGSEKSGRYHTAEPQRRASAR